MRSLEMRSLPILFASSLALWCPAFQASAKFPIEGSAAVGDFKVMCGPGLLPITMEGDLTGTLDMPSGQISLPGRHVLVGYCAYPAPEGRPSLAGSSKHGVEAHTTSLAMGPNGMRLVCSKGDLPFVLKGAATGSFRTNSGLINLHGDHNDVAVCLTKPRSSQSIGG
jgi:hypothetical protein